MPTLRTPSPEQIHRARVLLRDGMVCALERTGQCVGVELAAHHIIPRQVLRRELPEGWPLAHAIADERNGMMLCQKHHDWPGALVWSDVPDPRGLLDFAEQYNLVGRLMHQFRTEDRISSHTLKAQLQRQIEEQL